MISLLSTQFKKMFLKSLLVSCFLLGGVSAEWYETVYKSKIDFTARLFQSNIVCRFKLNEEIQGTWLFFYSIDKKINTIMDLPDAELWQIFPKEPSKYLSLTPFKNGTYYFGIALAKTRQSNEQNYQFWSIDESVVINNISAKPETIAEKAARIITDNAAIVLSNTNIMEEVAVLVGSNMRPVSPLLERPISEVTKKTEETPISEPAFKEIVIKRTDYFKNRPSEEVLNTINTLIEEMRKLSAELSIDANATEEKSFEYLLRYTSLNSKVENIYLTFMTYGYEWSFIPLLNHHYLQLTRSILKLQKNVIEKMRASLDKNETRLKNITEKKLDQPKK